MAAGINGIVCFHPPASAQPISTSLVNNRAIRIFGGNLYFSTQKASPTSSNGVYTFTTTPGGDTPAGLVTTPGAGTKLVLATGSASAISDFAFNPDGTIACVADTALGVQKWADHAGTWNLAYTFALAPPSQPAGAFGVAVDFSGEHPVIYATTTETNSTSKKHGGGNRLVRIVDTNASAAITYLAGEDRALGLLTTAESLQSAVMARFINHTAVSLSQITLQFTGELWRQSTVPKALVFHYVMDLAGTNSFDVNPADFVYLPNLDVNFPADPAASGGGPVDGNLAVNQITKRVVNQNIANWPPGGALWLVWQYTNTTGKAQGVGIDNLSFSAIPARARAPQPACPASPGVA